MAWFPLRLSPLRTTLLLIIGLIWLLLWPTQDALAQGSTPLLDPPYEGCFDVDVYGVGLFDGGSGSVEISPPGGEIVAAYMEWVGVEDTTPGALTLDGTSTLLVNSMPVVGTLAAPLDPTGNAGYDPNGYADAGPSGWFSWHADIGPSGLGLLPAHISSGVLLEIEGWDSPARQTNGATITLIYRTVCGAEKNQVQFLTGVNWYHHRTPGQENSKLLVFAVEPEPRDRTVRLVFSHAGTDSTQSACRGGAIWLLADDGSQEAPAADAFDLVTYGDNDGDDQAHGYGINGGVEIVNDPFTSSALPCVPKVNPLPDEAYAAGHPYPGGASASPYYAISVSPTAGGDVGMGGEWGVVEVEVVLPANAAWLAFQLESEEDEDGESGSWVGGGSFLLSPNGTIGDFVWLDVNGDGVQNDGATGINGVDVQLHAAGPDSVFGSADDRTTQTTTARADAGNGYYLFEDQPPGLYRVLFELPSGYRFTKPQQAGHSVDSDPDQLTGATPTFALMVGETNLNLDAGLVRLVPDIAIEKSPDRQTIAPGATARFTIVVTNTGELDLVDVFVSDPAAPDCDKVIGDLPVEARFEYVCELAQIDHDFTNVATVDGVDEFGNHVSDDDDAFVDVTPIIAVEKLADPAVLSHESGMVTFTVSIANEVDEPLELFSLQDDQFGDLNGRGDCTLPQTLPVGGGYVCRFQAMVTPGGSGHRNVVTAIARDDDGNEADDDDDATVIQVAPVRSSGVGDFVWRDSDADGLQDADERGVAGVSVNLYQGDGSWIAQATTDNLGAYQFLNLEAGDYYLTFMVPEQLSLFDEFCGPDMGGDDQLDSDVISAVGAGLGGRTETFSLAEGVYDPTRDAGLLVPTAEAPTEEPQAPSTVEKIFLPLALFE